MNSLLERPAQVGSYGLRLLHRLLRELPRSRFEIAALVTLLLAASSPFAAPVVGAPPTGAWHVPLLPSGDLVLLSAFASCGVWAATRWGVPGWSTLDGVVAGFALVLAIAHVLAVIRDRELLLFESADVRRLLMVVVGYFLVSRLRVDRSGLVRLVWLLAAVLAVVVGWLVLRHGLVGTTNFATLSGRYALLITEDALLVMVPLTLALGRVVDGLASRRFALVAGFALLVVLVIDLVSLRRGALIFIGAALAVRALVLPRRTLALGACALAVAGGAFLAGPGRSLAGDLTYAVRSSLLQTEDASTSQRQTELQDFFDNMSAPDDALLGHGIGAAWLTGAPRPVDAVAFGEGETAAVRLGWHIYGLDWAYRLGLLGTLAAVALLWAGVRRLKVLRGIADRETRSVVLSLAVTTPVLLLLALTNPRLALFAGVGLGCLSRFADLSAHADADGDARERPVAAAG